MVGIVGGTVAETELDEMVSATWRGDRYEQRRLSIGGFTVGVLHHGGADEAQVGAVREDRRACVAYGSLDVDEDLLDDVLERPGPALSAANGPFVLACLDAGEDRLVLATDRMKTYPAYYTTSGGLAFAAELKGVLPAVEAPTLDRQTVGDFLMTDWTWGDETLVKEVRDLPPAHVMDWQAGEADVWRYWEFDYGGTPETPYVETLASEYQRAVADTLESATGTVGVWLSGGLDSRVLAALVAREDDPVTLTYDANPGGGQNFEPARRIAENLDVPNRQREFGPDEFVDVLVDGISLVDGMISWVNYHDLVWALDDLAEDVDVLVNGAPTGGLIGEEMWPIHLEGGRGDGSVVDQVYHRHCRMDRDRFGRIVVDDVDPKASIRDEVEASNATGFRQQVLDVEYRNFNPNYHTRRNGIFRNVVSVRSPFADGALLDHLVQMPDRYRQTTVPFTGGRLNHPTSRLKMALARVVDDGIESVPYERTGLPPRVPFAAHTARYFLRRGIEELRGTQNASNTMYAEWYRNHDGLRRTIDGLLDAVCDRPEFDADAVRDLQREHHQGANNIRPIAVLTTVEQWRQDHLDPRL